MKNERKKIIGRSLSVEDKTKSKHFFNWVYFIKISP